MKRWALASVAVLALASVWGCASKSNRHANLSVMSDDPVTEVRTIVHLDTGPLDLGVIKWRQSTETLMREVPMSMYSINDEGWLIAFSPAFPPVEGVEEPPLDVPLKYVSFNQAGRLAGWEAYGETETPACEIKRTGNPPAYSCTNNSCNAPSLCVVVYEYNDQGVLKNVYCNCETTP